MNFIVSSTLLYKNLQAIAGVISAGNSLPILDNFLFDIKGNKLTATASDLHSTMNVEIDIQSESDGQIAVPAKKLLETLKTFAELPISFAVDQELFNIELSAGGGRYQLPGQNPADFPKVPVFEGTNSFEIDASILSKGINKTIFATGMDEFRPAMSGVLFAVKEDGLTLVSTDSHRLVKYLRKDIKSTSGEFSFIMAKKPLNIIKSILTKEDGIITVESNSINAFFRFNNIQLICRLVEGKFPNYEAVIPMDNPNKLTVDRDALFNTLRRASIYASQSTYQVRFKIAGQELNVVAEDIDYANFSTERIPCQYDGVDLEIAFNAKLLIEMLANFEEKDLLFEMSAPSRAGIIKSIEKDMPEEDMLMLIMPIMLS